MNILVTGAAGYIGSTLVGYLLEAGHHVTALDNFSHRHNSLAQYCADRKFEIVKADCRNSYEAAPLVKKADVIIPLAAIVGMNACINDQIAARTTNYEAVRLICDHASPSQWVLVPNSNTGYGKGPEDACTEDSPLRPLSLYGITKAEAERCVMQRENSVAFRLATVFGASPRHRRDLLLNDFVYRAVKDRFVVVFEPNFRRNFVHVRDVAAAFVYALYRFDSFRGKVFNCGDTRANMTKWQLCERIQKHVPDFTFMESKTGTDPDQRDYLISNRRLENTGWMPSHSIDDGIAELKKLYQGLDDWRFRNA